MTSKQLRMSFTDYTSEEQERDVERFKRLKQKDVYIMRVNGVWNAYIPRKRYPFSITGHRGEELTDFIKGVKESLEEFKIHPNFHNIINKGVEDYLKQQMIVQNLLEGMGRWNFYRC